jgi:hypothetical protein
MKTIYLAQVEEVEDIEVVLDEVKAFEKKEDAESFFIKMVEEIKAENNLEDWEIDEGIGEWTAYPDGEYLDRHFSVTWKALPLH